MKIGYTSDWWRNAVLKAGGSFKGYHSDETHRDIAVARIQAAEGECQRHKMAATARAVEMTKVRTR